MILKKSTNTYAIPFVMLDSADGITPKTGLTVTVTISKNGGAFAAAGGAVAELSNGWYKYTPTTTDTNTLGTMAIHATATGANATNITAKIVNYDPRNIQNAIWDEALTGATHNVATSAGRRLRTMMTVITKEELLDLCEKFEKKYPLIKVFGFSVNNIIVESKYTAETFTIPCWGLEALIEDNTSVYMTTTDKNV